MEIHMYVHISKYLYRWCICVCIGRYMMGNSYLHMII